jgi:hypothetical protein
MVNTLNAFLSTTSKGNIEWVYHLIGYLYNFPERRIMIDSSTPECVPGDGPYPYVKQQQMRDQYPDVVEETDPKVP